MTARRVIRPTATRSDAALIAAIVDGDLSALGELYDRYARDVWRAAYRLNGNAADAEDLVSSVFVKLPDIAKSYDGRANARPWLIGITANLASHQRRRVGRFLRVLTSYAATTLTARHLDPEREASAKQEVNRVDAAIAALAEKKRVVFTLIELEGMTNDEVARALSIPAATVRSRLHHARLDLYEAMKGSKGEG